MDREISIQVQQEEFKETISPVRWREKVPGIVFMITIDGSLYSGSGSIVRQSVGFSALTGRPIHLVNARAKREKPGLRRQHVRVVEVMCDLVHGKAK